MSELRKLSQVYSWRSVERKMWKLCGTRVLRARIWCTGGGVAGRRGAEFWRFCTRSRGNFLKMFDANVELECRCVSLFAESATSTLKCFRWRYRKHPEMFSIEKRIVSSELLIISALVNYVPAVAKREHKYWYQLLRQGYYEVLLTLFLFAFCDNETMFYTEVGESPLRHLIE